MKLKYALALITVLAASQASALTAIQKQQGCDGDVGNCSGGLGPAGGGSGEYSTYASAYIIAGSLWETFYDSKGDYDIETNLTTGKKTVHMQDKAAFLIKPPPPKDQMKRSALVYGPLMPAQTLAQAKQADEAEKAQKAAAAAKKAAEDKAVADAIQKAGGVGAYSAGLSGPVSPKPLGMGTPPAIPVQPAGTGMVGGTTTVVVQPVAGVSPDAITARKKP